MSEYRLSSLAELDLAEIADYSTDVWGENQAYLYLDALVVCFNRIAQMPDLGRASDSVHPGFRRIQQGKHIIFYKPGKRGVFIKACSPADMSLCRTSLKRSSSHPMSPM